MKYIRRCPIWRELKLKRWKMGDIMRQNRKVEEDGEWQERKWKKLTFLTHLHYIFCNTWYERDDGKRRSACWTLLSIGGRSPPQSSTSDSLGLFFPYLFSKLLKEQRMDEMKRRYKYEMKSNWGALNLYNRTTRTFAQVYCMRICFHHFFSSSGTFNPFSHHYLTLFVFFWLWFLYLMIRRTIVCITLPHFLSSSFKVPCVHLSSWRSQYSTFPLVHAYYCFFFPLEIVHKKELSFF